MTRNKDRQGSDGTPPDSPERRMRGSSDRAPAPRRVPGLGEIRMAIDANRPGAKRSAIGKATTRAAESDEDRLARQIERDERRRRREQRAAARAARAAEREQREAERVQEMREAERAQRRAAPAAGSVRQEPRATSPRTAARAERKPAYSPLRASDRPAPPRVKHRTKRRIAPRTAIYWSAVAALWTCVAFGGLVFYYAMTLPDTTALWAVERTPRLTILDVNGDVLARRGDLYGDHLSIAELPPYLPQAVLAIEDRRFYSHIGVDPIGLGRAMLANLVAGAWVQGGSTITQQLAKNLFLTPERTLQRKMQELLLALWLEARFSKDEILSLYLNRVYFGAGAYGVEAASQRYFNKSARYVTLGEAAMLAGLLKAPTRFAPTNNFDLAEERANLVLAEMIDAGFITEMDLHGADTEQVTLASFKGTDSIGYFVDWMVEQLPDFVGRPESDLIVQTTIDPFLQRKAEAVVEEALARDGATLDADQAAIVVMSTDGAVRAMVGGRGYGKTQFNRAVQARRQPGSAFKPFVYLAAMEAGLTPDTMRLDAPITIKNWSPENYGEKYEGMMTLREALARSVNTVAVRVSEEVGRENVIQAAHRLGIRANMAPHPSIALGTFEVTLLELTTAYTPFANGGYGVIPHGIAQVRTGAGETLYRREGSGPGRVIDPYVLGQMNNMLSETMRTGTGRKAALDGRPAAGKTGTSQSFRDAWFIGYTADLVVGVWVGNDDGHPMSRVTGGGLPAVMWHDFMYRTQGETRVADLPGTYGAANDNDSDVWWQNGRHRAAEPGFFDRLFGRINNDAGAGEPTLQPGRPGYR